MRILVAILLIPILFVTGCFAWAETNSPEYVYRYKLSISLVIDNQARTASSVIEVTAQLGPVGRGGSTLRGQAPLLDLGSRGLAIFSLSDKFGLPYQYHYGSGRSALWLGARAFGNNSTQREHPELPRLSGRRELPVGSIPVMVWFPDRNDPSSGRVVLPEELAKVFDPDARVTSAYVEITRDPVVIDIDRQLPWYKKWEASVAGRPSTQIIKLADGREVSKHHFFNDGSDAKMGLADRVVLSVLVVLYLTLDSMR